MLGRRAIVVGAGMGGLTTAQALARHFQTHAGEGRKSRASGSRCSSGSGDGLQKDVTLGSELHPRSYLSFKRR